MSPSSTYLEHLQNQVVRGQGVFIASNATVIGKVTLEENVSVWYNAVLRGDSDVISVGKNTNIQDHSVVHVDRGVSCSIGSNCIVGHRAIIHGCTIGDNCLIGMGAIVMNNAVIGDNCLIGANALITENSIIPAGSLVLGSPGKVVRSLTEDEQQLKSLGTAHYVHEAHKYLGLESF